MVNKLPPAGRPARASALLMLAPSLLLLLLDTSWLCTTRWMNRLACSHADLRIQNPLIQIYFIIITHTQIGDRVLQCLLAIHLPEHWKGAGARARAGYFLRVLFLSGTSTTPSTKEERSGRPVVAREGPLWRRRSLRPWLLRWQ
jgi:hypothetical protein